MDRVFDTDNVCMYYSAIFLFSWTHVNKRIVYFELNSNISHIIRIKVKRPPIIIAYPKSMCAHMYVVFLLQHEEFKTKMKQEMLLSEHIQVQL